jgi:hypothetical protein
MTVCDIEASPTPIRVKQLDDRIAQIQEAFISWREIPQKVTAQIRGLGLKQTITALVRFDDELESELEEILGIERKIKEATKVNVRDFTGHISLAYFVQYPGNCISDIKRTLLDCEKYEPEMFTFSQFDLTYFTDMNEYIPIMTIDLENRDLRSHNSNIQTLKTVRTDCAFRAPIVQGLDFSELFPVAQRQAGRSMGLQATPYPYRPSVPIAAP